MTKDSNEKLNTDRQIQVPLCVPTFKEYERIRDN